MPLMPVIFAGHGSPMNALEENGFTHTWARLGGCIPRPAAILCISAHWESEHTLLTVMERPKTIHDFGGFPRELYNLTYPAPGAPALAMSVRDLLPPPVGIDYDWGLDHGTWSVLCHMFPAADIPVFQLSICSTLSPLGHYSFAQHLRPLRDRGVLIIGSGNIVHNLGMVDMDKPDGFDWALEFDERIREYVLNGNHGRICEYRKMGKIARLAVPTSEHLIPLLYTLAVLDKNEPVYPACGECIAGSLSMTMFASGPVNPFL